VFKCRHHLLVGIPLLIAVVYVIFIHTFKSHQPVSHHYKITDKTSDGLKAYTKFTGTQFLIINHDPFDWMDVTVAVNAQRIENQVVSAIGERNELILTVPRIRSGGMYTLETSPLAAEAATGISTLAARTYSLRILGTTPWGKSSWDGRWE
jgi:hypothetical protein